MKLIYDRDANLTERVSLKRTIIEDPHIQTVDLSRILEIKALFDQYMFG